MGCTWPAEMKKGHPLGCPSLSKKSSKSWAFLRKYGIIEAVMKVIVKGRENRDQLEIFSIEGFVPADHLLRKIDSAVDFNHIYDIVEDLYCADNGRPSIDPVVIFKMVLIQHLYGLPSLRRTVEEIKMNVAYRWFLGYLMNEQIPHFSTVSYNFKHRYTEKTIEEEGVKFLLIYFFIAILVVNNDVSQKNSYCPQ